MEQNNDIRANVAAIREKMAEAARSCGRDPKEIKLCAATKMNDAARVKEAVAAGVDCCGENRVQELLEKQPQGAYEEMCIRDSSRPVATANGSPRSIRCSAGNCRRICWP